MIPNGRVSVFPKLEIYGTAWRPGRIEHSDSEAALGHLGLHGPSFDTAMVADHSMQQHTLAQPKRYFLAYSASRHYTART